MRRAAHWWVAVQRKETVLGAWDIAETVVPASGKDMGARTVCSALCCAVVALG